MLCLTGGDLSTQLPVYLGGDVSIRNGREVLQRRAGGIFTTGFAIVSTYTLLDIGL